MVQPVDRHSSKSSLLSPTPGELARLARKSKAYQPDSSMADVQPTRPRNLRRRLSRRQVAEIVSRYNAGDNTPVLAEDYGIAKSALLQLLRREGVTLRKQSITPREAKQAARLYESGLSIVEVVERIGYSYTAVRESLHRSGVAMRPKGIKRGAESRGR